MQQPAITSLRLPLPTVTSTGNFQQTSESSGTLTRTSLVEFGKTWTRWSWLPITLIRMLKLKPTRLRPAGHFPARTAPFSSVVKLSVRPMHEYLPQRASPTLGSRVTVGDQWHDSITIGLPSRSNTIPWIRPVGTSLSGSFRRTSWPRSVTRRSNWSGAGRHDLEDVGVRRRWSNWNWPSELTATRLT